MPAVADACAIASASPKPTVHIMPYGTTLNPTDPNSAAAAAKAQQARLVGHRRRRQQSQQVNIQYGAEVAEAAAAGRRVPASRVKECRQRQCAAGGGDQARDLRRVPCCGTCTPAGCR